MTIVCATHFTDSSFNAVKVAAGLARRHRQPLWLVSVLPIPGEGERAQTTANDTLLLEAAALANEGIDCNTAVLHGPIERAVGQFCTEKRALLLVVGDSSQDTHRLFAGTLDKFAFNVDLPMLVVRDPRPFEEWTRGTPLKVMLALDHTWSSAVARDWICRLAEYGPIDLVAAHIWWPADEYNRRGVAAPKQDESHTGISKLMSDETSAALRSLPANVTHRVHLEMGKGHIGEQLLALAAREQAQVLVLGTHPHQGPISLLRSVSHDVLMNAPMSVACVPGSLRLHGLSSELRANAQLEAAAHR